MIGVLGRTRVRHEASEPVGFDAAGLTAGVLVYQPRAAGELVLDAWVEVLEAFDGTTPQADIAQFGLLGAGPGVTGWRYSADGTPWDVSLADVAYSGDDYLAADQAVYLNAGLDLVAASGASSYRVAPGRLTSAEPVLVVVTQDGTKGGAAVGGTTGRLVVHLVIAAA